MKYIKYPTTEAWATLTTRPVFDNDDLQKTVRIIFDEIRQRGDKILRKYTEIFDRVKIENLNVSKVEFEEAEKLISNELKAAIQLAKCNIAKFHSAQVEAVQMIETTPGVVCWRENRPIEKVGIYIPGGSAPLFSTVLMLGIPAKIAGCTQIVLCTPPNKQSKINPAILYAAQLVGITEVFKVGGIQAIGALTFGTESVPAVYKIFGPGNQFVTAAKQAAQNYGVAIDMPAGPSEVLVIADQTAVPEFVAADLLSQAEHGADSQVLLLTDNEEFIAKTNEALQLQLIALPRKEIAEKA
ncbi:MAG TPA: histidinol dehydrogenase, partial [Bacteroidales bacterium]|nr:histidinol dehydrogenase [Bacteroidales bacterium]